MLDRTNSRREWFEIGSLSGIADCGRGSLLRRRSRGDVLLQVGLRRSRRLGGFVGCAFRGGKPGFERRECRAEIGRGGRLAFRLEGIEAPAQGIQAIVGLRSMDQGSFKMPECQGPAKAQDAPRDCGGRKRCKAGAGRRGLLDDPPGRIG